MVTVNNMNEADNPGTPIRCKFCGHVQIYRGKNFRTTCSGCGRMNYIDKAKITVDEYAHLKGQELLLELECSLEKMGRDCEEMIKAGVS